MTIYKHILVSESVYDELTSEKIIPKESYNDVLIRLLDLRKSSTTTDRRDVVGDGLSTQTMPGGFYND